MNILRRRNTNVPWDSRRRGAEEPDKLLSVLTETKTKRKQTMTMFMRSVHEEPGVRKREQLQILGA